MRNRKVKKQITVPAHIRPIVGVGTGINHLTEAELIDIWETWGDQVRAEFRQKYGDVRKPFLEIIGRREGWIAD